METETHWEVCWRSDVADGGVTRVPRRKEQDARNLARNAKDMGLPAVKLYEVSRTEVDF